MFGTFSSIATKSIGGGAPAREELHCLPFVMKDKSTGCQWACLEKQCGVDVGGRFSIIAPRESAVLRGVVLGADAAGTNMKLWRWIHAECTSAEETQQTDDPFVLHHTCLHHALSNIQSPVCGKVLDIATPGFCISKQFSQGGYHEKISDAVFDWLEHHLEWKVAAEHPDFIIDPADVAYSKDILEMMYVKQAKRTRRKRTACDSAETTKRRFADDLIDASPGDWRKSRPLHYCRGCCKTRQDAIGKMFLLVMYIFFGTNIAEPAEDRWTSNLPVMQDVAL